MKSSKAESLLNFNCFVKFEILLDDNFEMMIEIFSLYKYLFNIR